MVVAMSVPAIGNALAATSDTGDEAATTTANVTAKTTVNVVNVAMITNAVNAAMTMNVVNAAMTTETVVSVAPMTDRSQSVATTRGVEAAQAQKDRADRRDSAPSFTKGGGQVS